MYLLGTPPKTSSLYGRLVMSNHRPSSHLILSYLKLNFQIKHKLRGEAFKPPGEGICLIAHEENADLIVMGSQGEGTIKRMIIASVGEYVVKNVGIPVLVVRNKDFQPPGSQ